MRWEVSPMVLSSFFLFLSFSLCLSRSLSISLSISISLCISWSMCASLSVCLSLSVSLSLCLSLSLSISVFLSQYIYVFKECLSKHNLRINPPKRSLLITLLTVIFTYWDIFRYYEVSFLLLFFGRKLWNSSRFLCWQDVNISFFLFHPSGRVKIPFSSSGQREQNFFYLACVVFFFFFF